MSTNQVRWAVHYVDGPSRQFITRGSAVTLEYARADGCRSIADEHNRLIGDERDAARRHAIEDAATLEEGIARQDLLRRWFNDLVNGGWDFTKPEALRAVLTEEEDAHSVAECLRKVEGHEHDFVMLPSGGAEYWIEYNADCACSNPWGGQCDLRYHP